MSKLMKRETKQIDAFDRFDRMFADWAKSLPLRWPASLEGDAMGSEMIRVDEFRQNGDLVIRAEMPGIDPDKDVDLTVEDGMLRIEAEHREEEKVEDKGYLRREIRYGSFARSLPVPKGVSESDVKATYKDGILEIRIPTPEPEPAKKIEISKG